MTGSAAVMGIRKNDSSGTIGMFSEEASPPYNRPPLSKGLWGKAKVEDILRPMDQYNVQLFLETPVKAIWPEKNQIVTETGDKYGYAKLLIATGGHPIWLPEVPEGVIAYRTLADYQRLKAITEQKESIGVIGGGFIGSEIAAALNKNGKQVTLIFPERGISERIFPEDLSSFLNQYYQEQGVKVRAGQKVQSIRQGGEKYSLRIKDVQTEKEQGLSFDAVVMGIGIKPNVKLAQDAGVSVEDGIVVNEYLQTNVPNIYAAGDVANFYNVGLKKRTRVEHEDNANEMGMTAGLNMSGPPQPYNHFPFFYSDLFDLGYEAVGELNKDFEIVEDWIEPFKKGTLFYLAENKVKGVIFWNLWGKVDQGRALITKDAPVSETILKGMFSED